MTTARIDRRQMLAGLAGAAALPGALQAQTATPKTGGLLKISHSTRIAQLNVLQLSGPSEYLAVDMIYSGLTRLDPNMTPQPELAISWTAAPDAKAFTFRLRPGVTFHDGSPFTAADVVATFKAILDPATKSPARSVLDMIADIAAVDPGTVLFTLKVPYADFPVSVAHANARIVSAAALARPLTELDTRANGTGPFKIDSFDSARMLRLVKHPGYYRPGQPYLDAIEMYLFPDLAAETQNFLSGAMDVMLDVQQADFKRIAAARGVTALRVPSGRFVNIVMRQDSKPFDDVRVRNALAHAVDRSMLVDLVLDGLGRPAADNCISPGYRFLADSPIPPYDPPRARQLLAEAGYPQGIKIPLICSNRPAIRSQVGVAVKQMAAPAGFDIDVQTIPHDTYLANVWRKGNFYIGFWGMQPTEDAAFTLLFTTDAAFADTAWNNKEFDELVARGRSSVDDAERRRIYAQAQALMIRDRPSIIPFFQDVLTASRNVVKGWTAHPLSRTFYVENVWVDRA
ncbi:MAG: ABC transporter substrate-binding protein [Methylobacterium sp.]|jgi:peptide/nickel transport system substrate-binding protein|nr:ABC transporter substrate-binding protein [Methylobacterium sp.]MCA3610556.1 ABC transporter substrate-binding protein [Methylobacterium sp.]MCA3619033.1 ABC transporter substrate-binding protein [Methylobacterium sp.]MCA3619801.1 ABC transporter substrate-binding protein [Methylobacterium sp.]MCA3625559.1 ABC transporter substrate-binding protein [Methylobacterium sp.]